MGKLTRKEGERWAEIWTENKRNNFQKCFPKTKRRNEKSYNEIKFQHIMMSMLLVNLSVEYLIDKKTVMFAVKQKKCCFISR